MRADALQPAPGRQGPGPWLALSGVHDMVVPGAGVVRAHHGTNVGEVVSGDMMGLKVLF